MVKIMDSGCVPVPPNRNVNKGGPQNNPVDDTIVITGDPQACEGGCPNPAEQPGDPSLGEDQAVISHMPAEPQVAGGVVSDYDGEYDRYAADPNDPLGDDPLAGSGIYDLPDGDLLPPPLTLADRVARSAQESLAAMLPLDTVVRVKQLNRQSAQEVEVDEQPTEARANSQPPLEEPVPQEQEEVGVMNPSLELIGDRLISTAGRGRATPPASAEGYYDSFEIAAVTGGGDRSVAPEVDNVADAEQPSGPARPQQATSPNYQRTHSVNVREGRITARPFGEVPNSPSGVASRARTLLRERIARREGGADSLPNTGRVSYSCRAVYDDSNVTFVFTPNNGNIELGSLSLTYSVPNLEQEDPGILAAGYTDRFMDTPLVIQWDSGRDR